MQNIWTFQANPNDYDLPKMIQPGVRDDWGPKQHIPKIGDGETVIIWSSGDAAGIVGFGKIVGQPYPKGGEHRVDIEITERIDPTLLKTELLKDPVLKDLPIIKQHWAPNPLPVTGAQWEALRELRAGRPA